MSAPPESFSRLRLPQARDIVAATASVTALPLPAPDVRDPAFGRSAPFFPVVGGLLGCLLAAVDWSLGQSPLLSAAAVLILWEVLSRGALRRNVPALDPFAAVALMLKAAAMISLTAPRALPLVIAALLGPWSMVVLAVGARDAAHPGRKLVPGILFNEFAFASLIAFAAVFALAEGIGIFVVVVAAAVTLLLRLALHQSAGGISLPWLVRGAQLIEAMALAVLVPLRG